MNIYRRLCIARIAPCSTTDGEAIRSRCDVIDKGELWTELFTPDAFITTGDPVPVYLSHDEDRGPVGMSDAHDTQRLARCDVHARSLPRPDNAAKHVKFREKYDLPFTLLADEDHRVSEAYDVWVEKSYAGKTYMGVERSTFVIDPEGNVAKVMRRVNPESHADDVLAALS